MRLSGAVRTREWKEFFRIGLGVKLVDSGELIPAGEVKFRSHNPDPELAALLDETVALARADLARDIRRQASALERLAGWYREAFEESQRGRGDYRFGDITHLLRESRVLGTSDTLYFRLDAHIQHLLLDEFQDTSLAQWEVLEPVVSELLSGGEMERAAVVVADPKQSIYGWRGARPTLVPFVKERHGLAREELKWSYRSGPEDSGCGEGCVQWPGRQHGHPGNGWRPGGRPGVDQGFLQAGCQGPEPPRLRSRSG